MKKTIGYNATILDNRTEQNTWHKYTEKLTIPNEKPWKQTESKETEQKNMTNQKRKRNPLLTHPPPILF